MNNPTVKPKPKVSPTKPSPRRKRIWKSKPVVTPKPKMQKMKLVYINEIGMDWVGNHLYEFLFSESIDNIDGDDWDAYPASNKPSPPGFDFVSRVGRLSSKLNFELVQKSDTFAVWDAVDGIIALAWEDISDYDEYPDSRLYFKFGEDIKSVEDKLYEKDIILKYKEINKNIANEN